MGSLSVGYLFLGCSKGQTSTPEEHRKRESRRTWWGNHIHTQGQAAFARGLLWDSQHTPMARALGVSIDLSLGDLQAGFTQFYPIPSSTVAFECKATPKVQPAWPKPWV